MAIISSYNTTLANPDDSTGFDTTTNTTNNNKISYGSGDNGALVAIEVIFSLLVFVILLFCFSAGLKIKKRLRKEKDEMIESAVNQQENRIQTQLQGQCHSTATVTNLLQLPPPCYSPPDPTTQLSSATISRLDRLLLRSQICTLSTGVTLPKYTDLYRMN